ncbi:MAG: AAA family ATPase [Gemmataceae bacterium]
MELSQLIKALSDPACYPYAPEQTEVRQTHISVVFLAGSFVYKVKKPVDLGFLDFSTLDKRHHFCVEEVRLNRRLAPTVYLGVVPIIKSGNGLCFEGQGEAIEWAVKMKRLPDSATLYESIRRNDVSISQVKSLARRIASFHKQANRSAAISAFGQFDAVARNFHDVYQRSTKQIGKIVSRPVFEKLRILTEAALAAKRPLIEMRAKQDMICDTHGDLHLDHVYYFPEASPLDDFVIIDCIEFNERFRYADPVADMAFPVMDMIYLGRRDLADVFAETYLDASGDKGGRALLPLYTAYRAVVRGSVEGLKVSEKEITEPDQAATSVIAKGHWLLALGELEEPGRKPVLVLIGGLPGTGKSSLAHELALKAGMEIVRTDQIRKELAGLPVNDPAPASARPWLYSAEWTKKVYTECLQVAEKLLFEGKRILVDATFREDSQRSAFLKAAQRWGIPSIMFLCRADSETVRARLEHRRHDSSDAEWSTYQTIAKQWEEPSSFSNSAIRQIGTVGDLNQTVTKALDVLRELGL